MKISSKIKKVDSCIGDNTIIKGDIITKASLIIEGCVEGNILAEGEVTLGKESSVNGDITASYVTISGRVKGNVRGHVYTKLSLGSHVDGDIHTKTFLADEGSFFNGKCFMADDQEDS